MNKRGEDSGVAIVAIVVVLLLALVIGYVAFGGDFPTTTEAGDVVVDDDPDTTIIEDDDPAVRETVRETNTVIRDTDNVNNPPQGGQDVPVIVTDRDDVSVGNSTDTAYNP